MRTPRVAALVATALAGVLALTATGCGVDGRSFVVAASDPGPATTAPEGRTTSPSPAVARRPRHYVALGDSAAAGPVVVPQQSRQPAVCLRSRRNLPTLVAQRLGVDSHRDVTCSGATTADLFGPQEDAPRQLRAVTRRATLVSVGPIGANDAGIVQAVLECLVPGCRGRQGRSVHRAIEATRPDLRRALAAVERRAPRAEVVVVGYGRYLVDGGCPAVQPIARRDADYVQGLVDHMDRVLAQSARRADVRFVDLRRTPGAGRHTACAAPGSRWLEGLVPASLDGAIPFHPTALGMSAFAGQVARGVRR